MYVLVATTGPVTAALYTGSGAAAASRASLIPMNFGAGDLATVTAGGICCSVPLSSNSLHRFDSDPCSGSFLPEWLFGARFPGGVFLQVGSGGDAPDVNLWRSKMLCSLFLTVESLLLWRVLPLGVSSGTTVCCSFAPLVSIIRIVFQ